jgi:hypothetical protein
MQMGYVAAHCSAESLKLVASRSRSWAQPEATTSRDETFAVAAVRLSEGAAMEIASSSASMLDYARSALLKASIDETGAGGSIESNRSMITNSN